MTSERDLIWRLGLYRGHQIPMRSSGWILTWGDRCPYKTRGFGQTHARGEQHVEMEAEIRFMLPKAKTGQRWRQTGGRRPLRVPPGRRENQGGGYPDLRPCSPEPGDPFCCGSRSGYRSVTRRSGLQRIMQMTTETGSRPGKFPCQLKIMKRR